MLYRRALYAACHEAMYLPTIARIMNFSERYKHFKIPTVIFGSIGIFYILSNFRFLGVKISSKN